MTFAAAFDVGESSGAALVRFRKGERPLLMAAYSIHGAEHLWWPRAREYIREMVTVGGNCPCRVEVPPPVVRGGGMAHHRTGHGLGMRAGLLRAAWATATNGPLPPTWEPREWWSHLGITSGKRKHADRPLGWERVAQASLFVEGAREALDTIHPSRRVDVAESICQAAALALSLAPERHP